MRKKPGQGFIRLLVKKGLSFALDALKENNLKNEIRVIASGLSNPSEIQRKHILHLLNPNKIVIYIELYLERARFYKVE